MTGKRRKGLRGLIVLGAGAFIMGLVGLYVISSKGRNPAESVQSHDQSNPAVQQNSSLSRRGAEPMRATIETQELFYATGELRSRSLMQNGVLHGESTGWYTNGQIQVTEHYVSNVSHGVRSKWYRSGEKLSEAEIVNGKVHGRFQRWYANGQASEVATFSNGVPHGISRAWYEDGTPKAVVTMENGEAVDKSLWDPDGNPVR